MLHNQQLEDIMSRARDVSATFPISYDAFLGHERLAVLHLLDEPVQSTLHAILQLNVPKGTKCVYKKCTGTLNKEGACSEKCEQSGVNVVQDIMDCKNCDSYGFPCPTCHCVVFHQQLAQYMEDY